MKKTTLIILALMLTLPLAADEGMWMLPLLKQQQFQKMKELGLKLQDYDIYNPDGSSIKDAIVQFGRGCTGEVVSSQGLLLTNHHCGYSQIQSHSTLEHNYLENGFWAKSKEEELPNPGLTVTFIDRIEDVTDYVHQELKKDKDPNSMNYLSPRYLYGLAVKKVGDKYLNANPGLDVEIKAFYGGNQYYMFYKKIYSDIRLVGTPPSSIGKFGADTDNWMWPRHTGDFSVFRIYADKNGNPAPYSKDNQPLRPKRWLNISSAGVQENDFAFLMGFPGTTNKYYTSWEVVERRDIDNDVRIKMRNIRQDVILQEMLNDPQVKIQYASKYAHSTNGYKNAIGCNWAIDKMKLVDVKKQKQEQLLAWAKENNKQEYIDALNAMQKMTEGRANLRFRSKMLEEAILRGIEFVQLPYNLEEFQKAVDKKSPTAIDHAIKRIERQCQKVINKDYSLMVDRKVAKALLKAYTEAIPTNERPKYFAHIEQVFNGSIDKFVDYILDHSIYTNPTAMESFMQHPNIELLKKDPIVVFNKSIKKEYKALSEALHDLDAGYAAAHKSYIKGLLEMEGTTNNFPDANLTLRLSFGQVKAYVPRDAIKYEYQTTLEGVMEKEDPNNWEFVVDKKLKELYDAKDFGPYAMQDGRMPVCFTASTHTTGGNSGSPVMNANGELIGINFDRNWEGVGGDIQYLPKYQRSIIVDIRYVLFIIDKVGGAHHLIEEMNIVK